MSLSLSGSGLVGHGHPTAAAAQYNRAVVNYRRTIMRSTDSKARAARHHKALRRGVRSAKIRNAQGQLVHANNNNNHNDSERRVLAFGRSTTVSSSSSSLSSSSRRDHHHRQPSTNSVGRRTKKKKKIKPSTPSRTRGGRHHNHLGDDHVNMHAHGGGGGGGGGGGDGGESVGLCFAICTMLLCCRIVPRWCANALCSLLVYRVF